LPLMCPPWRQKCNWRDDFAWYIRQCYKNWNTSVCTIRFKLALCFFSAFLQYFHYTIQWNCSTVQKNMCKDPLITVIPPPPLHHVSAFFFFHGASYCFAFFRNLKLT
jgi:hypothetical protein